MMTTVERRNATVDYIVAPDEQQVAQIARFIQWIGINSLQRGYMQIAGGNPRPAEPSKIDFNIETIKSFLIDNTTERPDLVRKAAEYAALLDAQGYSTYCTMRLYKNRGRKQDDVHDSYLIFTDDVKDYTAAPLPFTLVVRTSEDSHHCYYVCDEKTTQDDAARVCVFHGADSTGKALNKFVRIPGTHNTKNYGEYPVTIVQRGQKVRLADVRTVHPEVASTKGKKRVHTPTDYDAAAWENLPDGAALAATGRYQKHITKWRPQLKAILIDGKRITTKRSDGSLDTSDSAQRAVFVSNMLDAKYHPAPENEIRALAIHFKDKLGAGLDNDAYQRHIDMCIAEYMPEDYKPVATKYTKPVGARSENNSPRKRGRPAGAKQTGINTLVAYLDALAPDTQGRKIIHQPTVARALGISIKTLYNRFEVLEAEHGIAKRQIDARGNFEIITTDVMRSENNSRPQHEAICSNPTPEIEHATVHIESTRNTNTSVVCVLSKNMDADLISEQAAQPVETDPQPANATARQAVADALDNLPKHRADENGEKKTWARTNKRIIEYITEHYGMRWHERTLQRAIDKERKERRYADYNALVQMTPRHIKNIIEAASREAVRLEAIIETGKHGERTIDKSEYPHWQRELTNKRNFIAMARKAKDASEKRISERHQQVVQQVKEQAAQQPQVAATAQPAQSRLFDAPMQIDTTEAPQSVLYDSQPCETPATKTMTPKPPQTAENGTQRVTGQMPKTDVLTEWAQTYTQGYTMRFVERLKARATVSV